MTRRANPFWLLLAILSACSWGGCSREVEADPKSAKGAAPNVTFKAGRGLQVSGATSAALGIATTEAKERSLASELKFTAQVYDAGPPALASAVLPASDLERIGGGEFTGAKLVRTVRALEPAAHQVELIFALAEPPRKPGEFVELKFRSTAANVLAVPRAAVIDGATGAFVYVVNGEFYLRTAVKTGAADSDWIEIADGLYAGDIVVTTAAQKLWLAEMLLTKGGGDID